MNRVLVDKEEVGWLKEKVGAKRVAAFVLEEGGKGFWFTEGGIRALRRVSGGGRPMRVEGCGPCGAFWGLLYRRVRPETPMRVRPYLGLDGARVKPPRWWRAGGPAWACAQGHVRMVEEAISQGVKFAGFLEEDVVFCEGFTERLKELLEDLPPDWDMCYLGGQHLAPPQRVGEELLRAYNVNRTHAYLVSRRGLPKVYQHLMDHEGWAEYGKQKARHIDHWLGQLHPKVAVYAPMKWLCGQGEGQSQILGKKVGERWWNYSERKYGPSASLLEDMGWPPTSVLGEVEECRAGTVLLVGNGPSARGSGLGGLVDGGPWDYVVRFNAAVREGYEADVGTRFDVHCRCRPVPRNRDAAHELVVWDRSRGLGTAWSTRDTGPLLADYGLWWEVDKEAGPFRKWASSGLLAAAWFIKRGYRVVLHGFDCFEGREHHYDGTGGDRSTHQGELEKAWFEKMRAKGLVSWLKEESP